MNALLFYCLAHLPMSECSIMVATYLLVLRGDAVAGAIFMKLVGGLH